MKPKVACRKCGSSNEINRVFCKKCGTKLDLSNLVMAGPRRSPVCSRTPICRPQSSETSFHTVTK